MKSEFKKSLLLDWVNAPIIYFTFVPSRAFLKKAATTSEAEKFESPKAKAEKSRLIRDKGNKAYSHKEFEVALGHFGESALVGPIDEAGRGREVAVALANRSAVHFEMEEWSRCLADIEASLRLVSKWFTNGLKNFNLKIQKVFFPGLVIRMN